MESEKNVSEESAKSASPKRSSPTKKAPVDSISLTTPYAIVRTGGKQYVVTPGSKLYVERLTVEVGSSFELPEVLCVKRDANSEAAIGAPLVAGASVKAKVLAHERGDKVEIYKKKRRKGYTKSQGHRQEISHIQIESINT